MADTTHLFWQFQEKQGADSTLGAELYYFWVIETLAFSYNVEVACLLLLFVKITLILGKKGTGPDQIRNSEAAQNTEVIRIIMEVLPYYYKITRILHSLRSN